MRPSGPKGTSKRRSAIRTQYLLVFAAEAVVFAQASRWIISSSLLKRRRHGCRCSGKGRDSQQLASSRPKPIAIY
jgi:hypothetical protein